MTLCEDDAKLTGPVAMFLGVEAANYNIQQLLDVAHFCVQHHVSTLFWKVFEVGSKAGDAQGLWYGGINGIDVIYQELQKVLNVVPYGFLYGDTFGSLNTEIQTAKTILQKYQKLCLDMEGAYWNNAQSASWATQIASVLAPLPGKLWLSCPADPGEANDMPFIKALASAVNIYMPMVYSNYLNTTWEKDFNVQAQCVQPTLDLSQEFGANDIPTVVSTFKQQGILALSCWEYGFALSNPSLLDSIVQEFTGQTPTTGGGSVKTNSDGTIATSPFWYQLSENEMALCGPTSAVMVNFSVAPGRTQNTSSETIDQVVDTMVHDVFGISDPAQFPGVSPQDMYNILVYLRDKYHKLHFQVVNSMDEIDRAVKSGYPCLFSCNEADISAWDKQSNQWVHAYTWMLSDGHVPGPVLGIESNTGNWLVTDPLNNRFQGYGPPYIYERSGIAKSYSWGAIIQLTDWLAPIPDLNNWPANFNAQNLGGTPVTQTPPTTPVTLGQAVLLGHTTIAQSGTTVTHGLGHKPAFVIPILDGGYSENVAITINYGSINDTSFVAYASSGTIGNVRFLVG